MTMLGSVTVHVVPWDDTVFTAAFERAASLLAERGIGLETPDACLELQHLLRAEGYPVATVRCDRDIDEALSHQARIIVSRDGETA